MPAADPDPAAAPDVAARGSFARLLAEAPATVAGFVRPVLDGAEGDESLGPRVGETLPAYEPILAKLRETPGDRLLRDRPGKPADVMKAGLLALLGDVDAAHVLAQAHEGDRDADAWHALVHRLEDDYGNSDYWWRRAGRHPFLAAVAGALGEPGPWDPAAFTTRYRRDPHDPAVRAVQAVEVAELLRACL